MEAQPLSAEEAVPPQEADPEPETQTQPANSEGTPPHSGAKTMQHPATTLLPLGGDEFPDEVLAVVCRFLGLADLGRLARVSRRFSERTLTELGDESGSGVLSAIEEGARVQVAGICGRNGTLASRHGQETWMRALWYLEHRIVVQQFETPYRDIRVTDAGATVTVPGSSCHGGYRVCSAIRTEAAGLLKWKMTLVKEGHGGFLMGVCPAGQTSDDHRNPRFIKAEPPVDRSGYWGRSVSYWATDDFTSGPVTLTLDLRKQTLSWAAAIGVEGSAELPQPSEGSSAYDLRPCVALSHGATVQSCM